MAAERTGAAPRASVGAIERELRGLGRTVVWIDLEGADSGAELGGRIVESCLQYLDPNDLGDLLEQLPGRGRIDLEAFAELLMLPERVAAARGRRVVAILEGFQQVEPAGGGSRRCSAGRTCRSTGWPRSSRLPARSAARPEARAAAPPESPSRSPSPSPPRTIRWPPRCSPGPRRRRRSLSRSASGSPGSGCWRARRPSGSGSRGPSAASTTTIAGGGRDAGDDGRQARGVRHVGDGC